MSITILFFAAVTVAYFVGHYRGVIEGLSAFGTTTQTRITITHETVELVTVAECRGGLIVQCVAGWRRALSTKEIAETLELGRQAGARSVPR